MTPPIRFLALVVGGWVAVRILALSPGAETVAIVPPVPAERLTAITAAPASFETSAKTVEPIAFDARSSLRRLTTMPSDVPNADRAMSTSAAEIGPELPGQTRSATVSERLAALAEAVPALAMITPSAPEAGPGARAGFAAAPHAAGRWSGSAWLLARGDNVASTAGVGLLGGSQMGARLAWRVDGDPARPLSLTGRLSSPLRRQGSEAAMGVEWQPVRGLPVRLLAERRQRIDGDGRSAFALLAHGGVSERPVGAGFTLDAYAQAGVVGARRRDLFADGGASVVRPLGSEVVGLGSLAVGGGVWGSAQPGVARLDIGPRMTTTIAAGDRSMRVSLDWRFRVAGEAAPPSGPSLTLGTDF